MTDTKADWMQDEMYCRLCGRPEKVGHAEDCNTEAGLHRYAAVLHADLTLLHARLARLAKEKQS